MGAGGIVSSAYCLLYKLYTLKLTRKQLMGLITHKDSPYIRGLGFMYIRSVLNIHVTVFRYLDHNHWCLNTGINLGLVFNLENILLYEFNNVILKGAGQRLFSPTRKENKIFKLEFFLEGRWGEPIIIGQKTAIYIDLC